MYRRALFLSGLPDPFAVLTVDGQQTKTTEVIKKTLNPYWNQPFQITSVTRQSIIAIQIFDQKKFKSKNQGFLGVVNISFQEFDFESGDEIMTLDLSSSVANESVTGKIIVNIAADGLMQSTLNSTTMNHATRLSFNYANQTLAGPSTVTNSSSLSSSWSQLPETVIPVTKPATQNASHDSTNSSSIMAANEDIHGVLPTGWERRVDHLNRTYYVDHNTRGEYYIITMNNLI